MDLKEMRRAAGLLQVDVAKKLNVTQCAVSYWESGKASPCRKYHNKLAKLYGCTVDDIRQAARRKENNNGEEGNTGRSD